MITDVIIIIYIVQLHGPKKIHYNFFLVFVSGVCTSKNYHILLKSQGFGIPFMMTSFFF